MLILPLLNFQLAEKHLKKLRKDFQKLLKFLFYVGCAFNRQKGSHRIYQRPDLKRPIIIPYEKELPDFIISANLGTLGISKKEFLRIIKEEI
ncbi:MAG: type II toxin-antitoxin system HicA family toxin [Armatimonadota bacterium]